MLRGKKGIFAQEVSYEVLSKKCFTSRSSPKKILTKSPEERNPFKSSFKRKKKIRKIFRAEKSRKKSRIFFQIR